MLTEQMKELVITSKRTQVSGVERQRVTRRKEEMD